MEINASYGTCIEGNVVIYFGLRVMVTKIKWSLNYLCQNVQNPSGPIYKPKASGFIAKFDLHSLQ